MRSFEATGDLSDLINRPDELAAAGKAWRGGSAIYRVAPSLGISKRTLEGIEQGRGFLYPRLLLLAMRDLKPRGSWR